jgi:hypothetical protein
VQAKTAAHAIATEAISAASPATLCDRMTNARDHVRPRRFGKKTREIAASVVGSDWIGDLSRWLVTEREKQEGGKTGRIW